MVLYAILFFILLDGVGAGTIKGGGGDCTKRGSGGWFVKGLSWIGEQWLARFGSNC